MRSERRVLSLRALNALVITVALVSSALLLLTSGHVQSAYETMLNAADQYVELQSSAYEMQKASDYLTAQVRSYVTTGDYEYVENYFEEVNVAQRREKSLEKFSESADSTEALKQLRLALNESNMLMETECRAMHLVALAYKRDLSTFPEQVREAQLADIYENLVALEKRTIAREMVTNVLYTTRKNSISNAMSQCLDILSRDLQTKQEQAGAELRQAFAERRIVIGLLFASVIAIILVNSLLIIRPLLKDVAYIREGRQLPVAGASELRFLARTYNDIYQASQKRKEELSYRVMHDTLTGVYNRAGYEALLADRKALAGSALLLADVDRFKVVNDTFGHQAGDRVLVKTASILRERFRADDEVCRIGGDEFAIFVRGADERAKERIAETVREINELLLHPEDGLPPVSLSVGCAFCNTDTLAKNADLALYGVKENGRCGCAFFEKE